MKKQTFLFLNIIILMFIAALIFSMRELFVVAASFSLVIIFSFLFTFPRFYKINVFFNKPDCHICKNEKSDCLVYIKNNSLLPILMYTVTFCFDIEGMDQSFTISLLPKKQVKIKLSFLYPYRGLYDISVKSAVLSDPFGLFIRGIKPQKGPNSTLTVYVHPYIPKAMYAEKQVMAANFYNMLSSSQSSDYGDQVCFARKYEQGDTLKKIDWKTTAKRHELYTRQFEQDSEESDLVLIDTMVPSEIPDKLMYADLRCQCAIQTVLSLTDKNTSVKITDTTLSAAPIIFESNEKKNIEELRFWMTVLPFFSKEEDGMTYFSVEHVASLQLRRFIYIGTEISRQILDVLYFLLNRGVKIIVIQTLISDEEKIDLPEPFECHFVRFGDEV